MTAETVYDAPPPDIPENASMIQSLDGMDLADRIREVSGRLAKRLDSVKTEEGTKTALVSAVHHARAWLQCV